MKIKNFFTRDFSSDRKSYKKSKTEIDILDFNF